MRYRVCGRGKFLGYEPGEEFIADLDYAHEQRAIARGSIEIVGDEGIELDPIYARLPEGWADTSTTEED